MSWDSDHAFDVHVTCNQINRGLEASREDFMAGWNAALDALSQKFVDEWAVGPEEVEAAVNELR